MNAAFEERRDFVVGALNAMPGVECQLPKGAFYVFPNIAGVVRNMKIDDAFAALPPDVQKTTSPSTLFQMFLLWNHKVATIRITSYNVCYTKLLRICGFIAPALASTSPLDRSQSCTARVVEPTSTAAP